MANKYAQHSKANKVRESLIGDSGWIKGCISKRKYSTAEIANEARMKVLKKRGVRCRVYKCKQCNYYHLTSRL